MNGEASELREKAERYRRLIASIDDRRTVEAISAMIEELEAQARTVEQRDRSSRAKSPEGG